MTFRPGVKLDPSQVRDLRFDRERGLNIKKQPAVRKARRRAVPPLVGPKRRVS